MGIFINLFKIKQKLLEFLKAKPVINHLKNILNESNWRQKLSSKLFKLRKNVGIKRKRDKLGPKNWGRQLHKTIQPELNKIAKNGQNNPKKK